MLIVTFFRGVALGTPKGEWELCRRDHCDRGETAVRRAKGAGEFHRRGLTCERSGRMICYEVLSDRAFFERNRSAEASRIDGNNDRR